MSSIRWHDMNWEKEPYIEFAAYHVWSHKAILNKLAMTIERYGQSKTANILFAVELTRRYKTQGVIANSVHPGYIQTELQRHMSIHI